MGSNSSSVDCDRVGSGFAFSYRIFTEFCVGLQALLVLGIGLG